MDSRTELIHDRSLRILLWDLDGTLVRGARYGIFKDYTVPMLESVFGTAGCLHEMIVSGMTDLQIVEEALRAIAAQRINEHLGANLRPDQFIVIGDTPNDIACARHFGARVVAVATGRIHSAGDLRAHDPDALLPNLLDSELVMKALDDL